MLKLLMVYQVLDAVLTFTGVKCLGHGLDIEGNPLMKLLMELLGPSVALFGVKAIAVYVLIGIHRWSKFPISVKVMITILCALYTFVVGTWFYVFATYYWSLSCS